MGQEGQTGAFAQVTGDTSLRTTSHKSVRFADIPDDSSRVTRKLSVVRWVSTDGLTGSNASIQALQSRTYDRFSPPLTNAIKVAGYFLYLQRFAVLLCRGSRKHSRLACAACEIPLQVSLWPRPR